MIRLHLRIIDFQDATEEKRVSISKLLEILSIFLIKMAIAARNKLLIGHFAKQKGQPGHMVAILDYSPFGICFNKSTISARTFKLSSAMILFLYSAI